MTDAPFIVAFDVDGTLIDYESKPRYEVIDLLRAFSALGANIVVWSGGGVEYADKWVVQLGLKPFVDRVVHKGSIFPHLVVDDVAGVDLGDTNFVVSPDFDYEQAIKEVVEKVKRDERRSIIISDGSDPYPEEGK